MTTYLEVPMESARALCMAWAGQTFGEGLLRDLVAAGRALSDDDDENPEARRDRLAAEVAAARADLTAIRDTMGRWEGAPWHRLAERVAVLEARVAVLTDAPRTVRATRRRRPQ